MTTLANPVGTPFMASEGNGQGGRHEWRPYGER